MAQQTIDIGAAPGDGTGTPWRDSWDICNDNFTELYGATTAADEAADTTCFLVFLTGATGQLAPKTNSTLAFNAATGVLSLGSLVVTGATTLTGIPTSDPSVVGQLYSNGGVLMISAG